MTPWRFFDFVRDNGENPFGEWLAKQDDSVQYAFETTMYYRRVLRDWVNPLQKSARKQFEILTKKHEGLAELRFFPDDGRSFRAFGLFRPAEQEFISLVGCEEMLNGLYYRPLNALKSAMKYKREFDKPSGKKVERIIS